MYLADDFRPSVRGLDLDQLDHSPLAAVGLRRDLTIGLANRAWAEQGAFLAGAVPGYPADDTGYLAGLPARDRAPLEAVIREVARTCEPATYELVVASGERSRRYRLRVMPLERGVLVVHHRLAEQVGA